MKISEMNNDQAAEAMIRLSEPFGRLCDDEKVVDMIHQYQEMNEQPVIQTIGKLLPQIVVYLLKTHKDDLYEIIGALTFSTKAQVSKMNFVETIKTVKESYDEVLSCFFTSSKEQIKKDAGELSIA